MIIEKLREKEHTRSQLLEELEIKERTLDRHLFDLKDAEIVNTRTFSTSTYYSLRHKGLKKFFKNALDTVGYDFPEQLDKEISEKSKMEPSKTFIKEPSNKND